MTLEFIDTNVLLYAYDAGAGSRHEAAQSLIYELAASGRAALSVQVLQEFYVNATRKMAVPVSPAGARERLEILSTWVIHCPTGGDVIAAAELSAKHQLSLWDAMIVRSAARLGCSKLWTEDLNVGQVIEGVEIANPFG
jgi:predicted nucleic acid-binding protein